jgi:hypothetical protein
MPDTDDSKLVNERELKIQRAMAIVKHGNYERYGINEVDERYIRSLPDWRLDRIIDRRLV